MRRLVLAVALACVGSVSEVGAVPLRDRIPIELAPEAVPAVVNTHTIFMNRCVGGCIIKRGDDNSRMNTSSIIGVGQGTLTAYPYGDASWNSTMNCMKSMFSRFNVTITDVDPGPMVDHMEIFVAGAPTQVGMSNGIGGVAPYACQALGSCAKYIPNVVVFDFANVWGNDPLEICATAAQEIAHTWSGLDHVIDASDPMTYNPFNGMRQYKDGMKCGSDCNGSQGPFGLTCVNNTRTCISTGTATQDEVKTITALFGPAGAKPPTVKINSPANGSAQMKGFMVDVSCTSTDGVQEVHMSIDGVEKGVVTTAPYKFGTPTDLKDGAHRITVLCATSLQATATATADIIVGQKCSGNSDCQASFICYSGACIAGGDVPGGLGAPCTRNDECVSGSCSSDGTSSVCVVPCDPSNDQCPSGFGCLAAGAGGVCWPGAAHGDSGGCSTSGEPGVILFGLGFAALLITRRRE